MWKLVTCITCAAAALIVGGYVKKSLEASKPQRENDNEIKADKNPIRETT